MSKKIKNSNRKKVAVLGAVLCVLIIVAIVIYVNGNTTEDDTGNETKNAAGNIQNSKEIQFPNELEDGKLKIDSLFQFTGFNPDCDNAEGEDISGIQLTNVSEEHLKEAEITVTLENGTKFNFVISDVPAGKTVMAFSVENASCTTSDKCKEITCKAEFEESAQLMEQVNYVVNGTEITVTNVSNEDLSGIKVYCHGVLDESYFGGVTYCYEIQSLKAGQSTLVNAIDCFLGQEEVVRISSN